MLAAGEVIGGDFEIVRCLSQGGMGTVFLARQRSTNVLRAVKVMLPRWLESAAFRRRFELEAKVSGRIASEHVVEVVDSGFDLARSAPFIAMEYLEGATLEDRVTSRGPPQGEQRVQLLRQLFHGVSAAHAAGVVHRDLKPSNLFMADARRPDAPFTLKILDFGIAKLLEDGTSGTQALGTRAWMAPEQEESGGRVTERTDVWALGLIVFYLLSGQSYLRNAERGGRFLSYELQFDALPIASARAAELGAPALSEDFDAWFSRSVARDPERRFATAGVAWQALRPLLPELAGGASTWAATDGSDPALEIRSFDTADASGSSPQALRPARSAAEALHSRPTRLYNVPQPSQSFVGRSAESLAVRAELLRGDVRLCAAIEGLPGVGKTELALQLAHQFAAEGRFPGGIFWLPAESPELSASWGSEAIAGALGVGGSVVTERAREVIRLLGRASAPLLVILDNVETWSETERPGPLPDGAHVTLFVSTRRHRLGGSRFRPFTLGVLPRDEARELLLELAGDDSARRPGFEALLDHLDGHALAVELAGAFLSEFPERTPADYLTRLEAGRDPGAQSAHLTRYERTVGEAFELLWRDLDSRIRGLWQLAAQFAPEPVSVELAESVGLDAEARRDLRRFHLIDSDARGGFRMHRMTRTFALAAGDAESRAGAARAFVEGAVRRAKPIILWSNFEIYLADRVHFDRALQVTRELPYSAALAELVALIATARHSIGDFADARELFTYAIERDIANVGEAHEWVASNLANLSLVAQDMGQFDEARSLLERALALDLAHRPEAHVKILMRRSNMGRLLVWIGRAGEARVVLERALDLALQQLGEAHWMVAVARSNLSHAYLDLGEVARARSEIEHALAHDLPRYGHEHPFVAARRFRLACVLEREGDLALAVELLEAVILVQRERLGDQHPTLGVSLAKLSNLKRNLGATRASATLAAEARAIARAQVEGSMYQTQITSLLAATV